MARSSEQTEDLGQLSCNPGLVQLILETGTTHWWLPQWLSNKESICNAGHARNVGLIPWRRAWQPTPVFLPGEFHGQRSLTGLLRVEHDWSNLAHTHHSLNASYTPDSGGGVLCVWTLWSTLHLTRWLLLFHFANEESEAQKCEVNHLRILDCIENPQQVTRLPVWAP